MTSAETDREAEVHAVEREIGTLYQAAKHRVRTIAMQYDPDLQPMGYGVLRFIMDNQPTRASDIASQLGVDKSALSRQIAGLREMGLIELADDPDDRRASRLVPTERALSTRALVRSETISGYGRIFESWQTEDVAQFAQLLHRFNSFWRE